MRSVAQLLLAVLSLSTLLRAEEQHETAKVQELLPSAGLYSQDELKAGFSRHQVTPFGKPELSFQILIPKDWESRGVDSDPEMLADADKSPVPMAEFGPGGMDDVSISVLCMRVPEKLGLDHFVDEYVKTSGSTLLVRQKGEAKTRPVEEAVVRGNNEDLGPMLTRVSAFRRGDMVFAILASTSEEKYEKYKRAFGAIASTFDLSGK